jgi:phage FluMu protein Com
MDGTLTIALKPNRSIAEIELRCWTCNYLLLKVTVDARGGLEPMCKKCNTLNRFDLGKSLP